MNPAPALLAALLLAACATHPTCPVAGQWVSPTTLRPMADPLLRADPPAVILLGETHDSPADHAWQLATIRRLYEAHPDVVLGLEMFPRRDQPVLDDWIAGRLSEADFLTRSDWHKVWGFPPELYLPIFRFARDHAIPMRALNVSQALVHRAGKVGWAAIPTQAREGIADPAPPGAAYRAYLNDAMSGHGGPAMTKTSLDRFIDAQTVWDSAMAQGIATQLAAAPRRHVVAIMGEGHLENGWGVPHQLDALGVRALVLLPSHGVCLPPGTGYADGLFAE